MVQDKKRKKKFARIILAYPFALVLIGLLANLLLLGVSPAVVSLPSLPVFSALAVSSAILLVNHSWLMTSTELVRLRYDMHATPEEWAASNHALQDVPAQGSQELERRHNAHRNATENVVYFGLLSVLISLISPPFVVVLVWCIGFAVGRLGYTYSYLSGRDGARGIFMSISLTALYGLASYLILSLVV